MVMENDLFGLGVFDHGVRGFAFRKRPSGYIFTLVVNPCLLSNDTYVQR